LSETLKRQTQVVVSLGEIRLHGDRHGDDVDGNVRLAHLQGDHAKQMQGDRLLRVGLEDPLIDVLGLGQTPRHVVLAILVESLFDATHYFENP
jgi:hypothetical protein